jgi:hypothetical protein
MQLSVRSMVSARLRWSWALAAVLVALATTLYGLTAPASGSVSPTGLASTAAGWTVKATPNSHSPNGILRSDSCISRTSCLAVGSFNDTTGTTETLAEAWNGKAWRTQTMPVPIGASYRELSGVSCTSAVACTAVGHYDNHSGAEVTLAELWNGKIWRVQATPNPSGATDAVLSGVSCTSATACEAVGSYSNSSGTQVTLAEAYDGKTWTLQATPGSGAFESGLSGVSCSFVKTCTAVGETSTSAGGEALAEVWNGKVWSIQTVPLPSGGSDGDLFGVSCVSPSSCTAVGGYDHSGTSVPLVEVSTGKTWNVQPSAVPRGGRATGSGLLAVSCRSSKSCTAVGEEPSSSAFDATLGEVWNGSKWKITPTPRGGDSVSILQGVSCLSSSAACMAVGWSAPVDFDFGPTLAEQWNGISWKLRVTPNITGALPAVLNGISCASSKVCITVGETSNASGTDVPLAESWNGSTWKITLMPNPAGSADTNLNAVSCTSSTSCIAVGLYVNGSNGSGVGLTLAEAWNGKVWRIQTAPKVAASTNSELDAVSCASASACTAVGDTHNGNGDEVTLAELWNGKKWKVEASPHPAGATSSVLSGVSCPSSTKCLAVGNSFSLSTESVATLAEAWNGRSWTIKPTPISKGSGDSVLTAVSCTSSTACAAVGHSNEVALAERYNGNAWTIQSIPNPSQVNPDVTLSGVSCSSPKSCEAVGDYFISTSVSVILSEKWNGTTWAVQSTPNPSLAVASDLDSVSCTSATSCSAAGWSHNPSFISTTLAEAFR